MNYHCQLAKKGVSDSLGLVDFTIRQVNLVLNSPDKQVMVLGNNQSYLSKNFSGLVKMTLGLVHASYSLPEMASWKSDFLCTLHYA